MAEYSLGARCISEGFGTMTFVFFVLTLLANKLLPHTKGHDLSYGWLSFGVGMAVFIPVQFQGHISTSLNPAMTLGSAIVGNLEWRDLPFIASSQTLGAFLGACLMYLYYQKQFKTNPEPPPQRDAERLLRTRDDLGQRGLDFVSYNTREPSVASLGSRPFQFRTRWRQSIRRSQDGGVIYNAADVLGHDATVARAERHHSVSVADLHHRLKVLEQQSTRTRRLSDCEAFSEEDEITVQMMPTQTSNEISPIQEHQQENTIAHFSDSAEGISHLNTQDNASAASNPKTKPNNRKNTSIEAQPTDDPLCCASIIADRNMKLSIFCTRPASYNILLNLLTEMISTFFLVIGILFIDERTELLHDGFSEVYVQGIRGIYFGLLISQLVLSLGGTGVAMNPARDLAPRFAHWILPIDGKGVSEWYYAWIPIVGPLMGAAVGGGLFLAMKEMNKGLAENSEHHEDFQSILTAINN